MPVEPAMVLAANIISAMPSTEQMELSLTMVTLEEPTSGKILFDGVDLADRSVNIDLHRQKMGMVFQHFNLFPHKTVLQNITMAPVTLKKKTPAEAK